MRSLGLWLFISSCVLSCKGGDAAVGEPCEGDGDCASQVCSLDDCTGSGVCVDARILPVPGNSDRCLPPPPDDEWGSEEDGSTGEESGPLLDIGTDSSTTDTAETGNDSGCEKIDFLFVIDNSGSMADEQDRLIAAFPGFLDAIRDNVQGQDHHIMVVDSDENAAWVCEELNDGSHCSGGLNQQNCEGYPCGTAAMLDSCARELGGGVTYAYGGRASNMDCGFPAGRRYLTSDDANLDAAFACAGKVGTSGNSVERPMSSMVRALSAPLTDPGDCNEGFLREDAILVVTIVTDDPPIGAGDDAVATDPMPWYQAILDAKGGDANASVVIGFLPTQDLSCVYGNQNTPVFEQFMSLVGTQGVSASVCDLDYAGVFANAISTIDTTCDTFEPPG